jgi:hypothetical protein
VARGTGGAHCRRYVLGGYLANGKFTLYLQFGGLKHGHRVGASLSTGCGQ